MAAGRENVGLKQFRADGCLSYVLYDRKAKKAVVIDPTLEMIEEYRSYLAERHLELLYLLETHTHADHYSGSHVLRSAMKAEIAMGAHTKSERATRKLKNGDEIAIGNLKLKVLETPGHTPDSISFFGEGLVFTGDALFIGSSGRTDFPEADPAQQWSSVHQVLGKLPGETIVLPGHDYNDLLFSTIATEREKNPHWLLPTKEAFIELKNAELISTRRDEILDRIKFNTAAMPAPNHVVGPTGAVTACGVQTLNVARSASISVDKYRAKLDDGAKGTTFMDVREGGEYTAGHIPGTVNVPMSEVALHLDELKKSKRVYVSCQSGRRSAMVANTLTYVGINDAVNVSGGIKAWAQSGYPVEE